MAPPCRRQADRDRAAKKAPRCCRGAKEASCIAWKILKPPGFGVACRAEGAPDGAPADLATNYREALRRARGLGAAATLAVCGQAPQWPNVPSLELPAE